MIPLTKELLNRTRRIVAMAVEVGAIVDPGICETCGKTWPRIKHHRDYNKPLEVTWLCGSCHKKEHVATSGMFTTSSRKKIQTKIDYVNKYFTAEQGRILVDKLTSQLAALDRIEAAKA
jgi:hypothetical protein